MRSVLIFVAMVGMAAGPATEPTTKPTTLAEARERSNDARHKLVAARRALLKTFHASKEYKAAEADIEAKRSALDAARANGTPQERLAASAAYVKAAYVNGASRLELMDEDAISHDPTVQAAYIDAATSDAEVTSRDSAAKEAADEAVEARHTFSKDGLVVHVDDCSVRTVKVAPLDGTPRDTADEQLVVTLTVRNSTPDRKMEYKTWAGAEVSTGDDRAIVHDELGNYYRVVDYGIFTKVVGRTEDESIYPGKSLSDVLVFEVPVAAAHSLIIKLPGGNVGLDEPITFNLSRK
jgi:multidrug efflux pump subunit AcrA (membrane-fusion protein)